MSNTNDYLADIERMLEQIDEENKKKIFVI